MAQLTAVQPVSALEQIRIESVFSMLPEKAPSVLEIGARHGVITERLAERYQRVTALDLTRPPFELPGVTTVAGDVQRLQFPDNKFDCVVCTEVLEHVPDYLTAARELLRVARTYLLVGVPFNQDTRAGRTTCIHCRKTSPPFGHINTFTREKLEALFPGAEVARTEFVAENRERTNIFAAWLQDFALNPYGTYNQEECCIHCGERLERPVERSFPQRVAGALGLRLYQLQQRFNRPQPTWILLLLRKRQLAA